MHTLSLAEAHPTTPTDGKRFLRLLADESRQAIVRLLALSDQRAGEIGTLIRLPPNAVSYHLKQLRAIGLLCDRRSSADARDVYYQLLQMIRDSVWGQAYQCPNLTSPLV